MAANSNANQGGVYSLNLVGLSDPGYSATQYTVSWGDGQSSSTGTLASLTHTFNTVGKDTISVAVTDATGTFSSAAVVAISVNSPPTAGISGNSNANVGGTYILALNTINDPGYTPTQYTVNWGDGQSSTAASLGTLSHSYAATGSDHSTVGVTDSTGTYNAAAALSIIVNHAPTVSVSGSATTNNGGAYTLNLNSFVDIGYTPSQYIISWGDGQSTTTSILGASTHTFTTTGPAAISVSVTDSTGTYSNAGALPITVNPSPTVTVTGNANANSGGIYTLNLTSFTDSTFTPTLYTVNWGDGQSSTRSTLGALTHTFSSIGADAISVSVTDAGGTYNGAGTLPITVNPSPTVALTSPNNYANKGGLYTLTLGGISDPGYSASLYTINWGDGQSTKSATLSGIHA